MRKTGQVFEHFTISRKHDQLRCVCYCLCPSIFKDGKQRMGLGRKRQAPCPNQICPFWFTSTLFHNWGFLSPVFPAKCSAQCKKEGKKNSGKNKITTFPDILITSSKFSLSCTNKCGLNKLPTSLAHSCCETVSIQRSARVYRFSCGSRRTQGPRRMCHAVGHSQ